MSKLCTGCGKPPTDFIILQGRRLPYHIECALEAWRDLRDLRDGVADALAARIVQRCTCDGRYHGWTSYRPASRGPFPHLKETH